METQPQENSEVREAGAGTPSAPQDVGEEETNGTQRTPWIRFREILRESFEKARKAQQPVSTRRELSKDKSKSLFVLVGAAVLVLLIFLGVFSSPQKAKKPVTGRRPGTPDLGRRVTPGQENAPPGSVTPMLNAEVSGGQTLNNGDVTAEDVGRTARLGLGQGHAATLAAAPAQGLPQKKNPRQYALNKIDFDSALAQQPGYGVGPTDQQPPVPRPATKSTESDELRKPSLVFVRAAESSRPAGPAARTVAQEQGAVLDALPPGTRLVARLESAVSTAVKEPVVAVIEYNYERDGEIIMPAGAKAVGQLRQANRSGYVDIKFDMLEMPDGTTEKMDGVAMDLKFGPLKGYVAGRRTGTKFLVRSLTGVGTVAAYLVGGGAGTGFNGPLSESALLRERIANNVGIAGDQELNELAFTQNIVVTVPGNTRFYIVLENVPSRRSSGTQPATLASAGSRGTSLPSLDELRQLMQLKQELSAMYQQASAPSTVAQAPQQ